MATIKEKRMKSIREKAEEYSRCIASSEYTNEDFVSGANYVLEQIEKQLDYFSNFEDSLIVRRVIEQLKK